MTVQPEEVWTIPPTGRVLRLRDVFVNLKPKFEIERARILTQTMKETEGEPMVIRRAKAFRNICRRMPLTIEPDELFVGYISETRGGVPVVVEYGPPMETVLNYKGEREFILTPEDEKNLREEIIPYWKGNGNYERTPWGYVSSYLKNSFFHDSAKWPAKEITHVTGGPWVIDYGHQILDFEQVLEHGFLGIKNKAQQKLQSLDPANPDHLQQLPFVRAVIIAMEGAAEVGSRFAAKSREMAEIEQNSERKADLLKIAECCEWVPANPARTFYEALQAVYFTWFLQLWESQESKAISLGHPDQYLMKYYRSDVWEGRLTKENAQELIDCFLLCLSQVIWKGDDKHSYVVGDTQSAHVSVGGYKADGSDATNELSYMFIEGVMHLRLPDPNLSIQMHTKTPEEILIKGVECVSLGGGQPMFVNADTVIMGLLSRQHLLADDDSPISLADARTFAEAGCNEPFIPGKDGMDSSGGMLNVAMAMDLALNNGVSRIYKTQIGPKTGDPRQFRTFAEVKEAFCIQLQWIIKSYLTLHNVKSMALADLKPTVFASSLLGCLEKGKPREAGGCCFNLGPGIMGTGIPDCADSLTAVKKVVFDDKKATMAALIDALDQNFNGCEVLHKELLAAPKYGIDDEDADEMMKWVTHFWATEVMKHKNTRGGHAVPGVMALWMFAQLGLLVGALPSGRKSGYFLSNGISPCNNAPIESPTQVINSLGRVDNSEVNAGSVLNMTLDPSLFDQKEQGCKRIVDLLRGVIDQKIFHIQFNVLDVETLRAAQREPEKHKDLIVRIAGYSTYFVALIKEVQDEIINRKALG